MIRFTQIVLLAFCILLHAELVISVETLEEIKSPHSIPGSVKINAEELVEVAERYPDLMIIDSRKQNDRQFGYIVDSVSLPDEATNCDSLSKLITEKDQAVVYYCNGPKCGRSAIAVKIALKCGYTNIFWFRGGFEEWKIKRFPIVNDN